jgi:hypothetical protein
MRTCSVAPTSGALTGGAPAKGGSARERLKSAASSATAASSAAPRNVRSWSSAVGAHVRMYSRSGARLPSLPTHASIARRIGIAAAPAELRRATALLARAAGSGARAAAASGAADTAAGASSVTNTGLLNAASPLGSAEEQFPMVSGGWARFFANANCQKGYSHRGSVSMAERTRFASCASGCGLLSRRSVNASSGSSSPDLSVGRYTTCKVGQNFSVREILSAVAG